MLTSSLLILAGLIALYFGAEWLVRGANSLAIKLGMTPLVAGLTVVAFGTSSPELVVSITASLAGSGDIAVGNVVGSNIFNIALILGLTALIVPLAVQPQLKKFDTPYMIGTSLLFLWMFQDHEISRIEAGVLFSLLVIYLGLSVSIARKASRATADAPPVVTQNALLSIGLIILGLGVLIAGSKAFVIGAVDIARSFGVSEAVIGLTIVAAGTSLPELAASLVAAYRKHAEMAIGNIIGSNIFNILCILGISGLVSPLKATGITPLDLWSMIGLAAAMIPILWTGSRIGRLEGLVLVAAYGGYLFAVWPK